MLVFRSHHTRFAVPTFLSRRRFGTSNSSTVLSSSMAATPTLQSTQRFNSASTSDNNNNKDGDLKKTDSFTAQVKEQPVALKPAHARQTPLPPIIDEEMPASIPADRRNLPRVVIIGTGWAGSYFVRTIDPNKFNVTVLSQRNHMLFTPLLPQTATGTLEFRSICEPVLRIQPQLAHLPNRFLQTLVWDVDFDRKAIQCVGVGVIGSSASIPVESFEYHYDYLILAHGARPSTFNIPGVEEHAFFLREITEARGIRRRIVSNIMAAALPTTSLDEIHRLLHIVVVGGGPIGVEFAGDLADFLKQDIPKLAPNLKSAFRVTLVEANEILGTFDLNLRKYGVERLNQMGIEIRKAVVAEVTDRSVILTDGSVLDCGLVVWATGVGASSLNKALKCDKNRQGRLSIDKNLRVLREGKPVKDCYALGDCAADTQDALPTLAAVASRQGAYLANTFNQAIKDQKSLGAMKPFTYTHLLSMASLGSNSAVVEVRSPSRWDIRGISAWLMWRSAYFTMLGSMRSRLYVIVNWCGSYIFGRDTTYIAELSESKLWKKMAQEGASKEQTRRKLLRRSLEERAKREQQQAQEQAQHKVQEQAQQQGEASVTSSAAASTNKQSANKDQQQQQQQQQQEGAEGKSTEKK